MASEDFKFNDIAPYDDAEFQHKMRHLVEEPGFLHAVGYAMPKEAIPALIEDLLKINNKYDFQHQIMFPFLEMLAKTTTSGITIGGVKHFNPSLNYTFITNHRDIVLDASFLNLAFLRHNLPTTEVAIGDNLLIYDWISDLVRLNKSFIVRRNTGLREGLMAAKKLSAYIHYTILEKHESIWIAQREGRAKDSSDHTQDSLVKMLALGGEGMFMDRLKEINLMPVAISYEYDPNDYLKTREYLLKHRDPAFKKSQHDDLFSMETGLMGYKGRVHIAFSSCISSLIESISADTDKQEVYRRVCHSIDCGIHGGYKIFPINYVSYDRAFDSDMYSDRYSSEEAAKVTAYIEGQLDKIDVPDITVQERNFMRTYMYTMYANPLRNKLIAAGYC